MNQHFPYSETGPDTVSMPSRKERLIEVLVVLFLIVPSMILSLFVTQLNELQFLFVALSTIMRDLGLLFLVLFLAWRNREPMRRMGWRWERAGVEILWGVALFFPVYYAAGLLQSLLQRVGLSAPETAAMPFAAQKGTLELVLAVLLVIVVAISEETLFRGYLILRFTQIADNRWVALIVSSGIFALGHGYAGSAGVLTVLVIGFALGLVFIWRHSLIAPVIIHFLQNFVGIVVAPFLQQ